MLALYSQAVNRKHKTSQQCLFGGQTGFTLIIFNIRLLIKGSLFLFCAMFRKIILVLFIAIGSINALAQSDSSHLRISLLICGTGDEIWESFGHTGVRIIDSIQHKDIVYNYGTFNGYDKDFEIKFMRGRLLYYVSIQTYPEFMEEYVEAKRRVQEQVLQISGETKHEIDSFLQWNAEPANRDYKYDFYYDNCATRIRDIFPMVLGKNFSYGPALPSSKKISFRNITDQYLMRKPWESFGIDILLGSKIDKIMTDKDIMFLPDFLRDGLAGATVNGAKVAPETKEILPASPQAPVGLNPAFMLTSILALLTILGLSVPKLRVLGNIMSFLMLFITGLLGCLILVMWFGTDHAACGDNFNILWALPTNLFMAFAIKKGKSCYASMAITLMVLSLLLHLFKVQELPLLALSPILLALLAVYGSIYRRSKAKPV